MTGTDYADDLVLLEIHQPKQNASCRRHCLLREPKENSTYVLNKKRAVSNQSTSVHTSAAIFHLLKVMSTYT